MECVICGDEKVEVRHGPRTIDVGSYEVTIEDHYFHCDSCGEDFHTGEQAKALDQQVIEARRRRENLLSAADIRRIRLAVGLSQADFEAALGIGPKTMIRWETSITVHSKSIDDVLRLIEFDPDNLRLLVRLRQAARATVLEAKIDSHVLPEDYIKHGELQSAIADGLERANIDTSIDPFTLSEAIFAAIRDYKQQRIAKLSEESRVLA